VLVLVLGLGLAIVIVLVLTFVPWSGCDGWLSIMLSDPSSHSPTQLLNRTARRYTSSFS
jgi:hypothetical protein